MGSILRNVYQKLGFSVNILHNSNLHHYKWMPVRYLRGSSRPGQIKILPEKLNKRNADKYEWNMVDEIEDELELEFTEDQITLNENLRDPNIKKHAKRIDEKNRKRLKFQILKHKYFKGEKEENLLTWKAKDQIRYLHKEYPDEWSINRLTQVFPVSRYGVTQIVKSKFIGVTEEQKERHDKKVFKNWIEIADKMEESVVKDQRLQFIFNAAGNADLPFPKEESEENKTNFYEFRPTPFSDLLKKYPKYNQQLSLTRKSSLKKEKERIDPQELLIFCFKPKDSNSKFKDQSKSNPSVQSENLNNNVTLNIDIPQKLHKDGQIYQKGKTVYNDKGEFLFKIP
ncbi:neugrin [Patella vulgata]|uniref:neugrin n=1 Tax=Patella vulgata TaxID=6465 RepID=UPI0024A7B2A5|nr:neugrin [Patella vulgata]